MATDKQQKFFSEVTEEQKSEVVEAILKTIHDNNGTLDWSRSWDIEAMRPQNPVTGTKYRGINRLFLAYIATKMGYADPRWMTFNQAKKLGYSIKKGSKGAFVEKWGLRKTAVKPTEEQLEKIEQGLLTASDLTKSYLVLQGVYKVFNGSCIEGLGAYSPAPLTECETYEIADRFIELAEAEVLEIASERAYYSPVYDRVVLPMRKSFESPEAFCATLFHELAHSTGHESRLNRSIRNQFGSEEYAKEELRAELASTLIQAEVGFTSFGTCAEKEFKSSCAYLESWAKHTDAEDVEKAIIGAVADATAICDYLTKPYLSLLEKEKTTIAA